MPEQPTETQPAAAAPAATAPAPEAPRCALCGIRITRRRNRFPAGGGRVICRRCARVVFESIKDDVEVESTCFDLTFD